MRAHVLQEITLPDRYEPLVELLGDEVAKVLTTVSVETLNSIEDACAAINSRGEGIFVPIYAPSGAGKTTFVSNLHTFFPRYFFKPRLYPEKSDSIDIVSLREIEEQHKKSDQTKSSKILPIIIDHRESDAPNSQEISVLKRFLRTSDIKCIILWLTTNRKLANQMAEMIEEIAGRSPIELPLIFLGPPHSEWQDITLNTMIISNGIQDIADLGINPKDYLVDKSRTIGEFIRNISNEFNRNRLRLIRETRKPISLIVVFVTNSQDPGILGSLTNSNKYGLIEGQALLQSSPNSEVGR